jgi:cytochrome b involved in lipid metabolism
MIYSPRSNTAPVVNAGDQTETYIPMKEVARHNLAQDAWVVVDGKVYE